jgi:hypothetical protein
MNTDASGKGQAKGIIKLFEADPHAGEWEGVLSARLTKR